MTSLISRSRRAVAWIMSAPPGERRTQAEAAARFEITQTVVSLAMKRHVAATLRPDGRRIHRRPAP